MRRSAIGAFARSTAGSAERSQPLDFRTACIASSVPSTGGRRLEVPVERSGGDRSHVSPCGPEIQIQAEKSFWLGTRRDRRDGDDLAGSRCWTTVAAATAAAAAFSESFHGTGQATASPEGPAMTSVLKICSGTSPCAGQRGHRLLAVGLRSAGSW